MADTACATSSMNMCFTYFYAWPGVRQHLKIFSFSSGMARKCVVFGQYKNVPPTVAAFMPIWLQSGQILHLVGISGASHEIGPFITCLLPVPASAMTDS